MDKDGEDPVPGVVEGEKKRRPILVEIDFSSDKVPEVVLALIQTFTDIMILLNFYRTQIRSLP